MSEEDRDRQIYIIFPSGHYGWREDKPQQILIGLLILSFRYLEKYKSYTKTKDEVCDNLKKLEKMLRQSLSQIPTSYKEALEHLEASKVREALKDLKSLCKTLMQLCIPRDSVVKRSDILYPVLMYI